MVQGAPYLRTVTAFTRPEAIHVVGGGLAGSEAAWQLAERGHDVVLHEMRPLRPTPAHKTDKLAELVCSNTFKSTETSNAHGLLKAEMRVLGSMILDAADGARVPGGSALTVDRDVFSRLVHTRVSSHPRISVVRNEVTEILSPCLIAADQFVPHDFDTVPYFEGCMPIEEMARRGRDAPRFGPMKPVGLVDPRGAKRPYAVVQLRMEDRDGRMWNMVGFQTRLRYPEQQRVFRMIPGLENAEFLRYGSIHRNAYINSPAALTPHLSLRDESRVLFAGQLT